MLTDVFSPLNSVRVVDINVSQSIGGSLITCHMDSEQSMVLIETLTDFSEFFSVEVVVRKVKMYQVFVLQESFRPELCRLEV